MDKHHNNGWERVKEAFRRDWEQTRNDFGSKTARDLDQDVDDTVKQAFGKQPIPADATFESREHAFRYGYEAHNRHDLDWSDDLGTTLSRDYDGDWERDRPYVHYGYSYGRRSRSRV